MRKGNKRKISKWFLALGAASVIALSTPLIQSSVEAETYYVDDITSLISALNAEGEKNVVLTADISINQNLVLNGEINISSNDNVTIARDPAYLGDLFTVGQNAVVVFEQKNEYVITFDGGDIVSEGSVFRINDDATLKIKDGITIKDFDSTSSGTVAFNYGNLVIDGCSIFDNKMTSTSDKYGIIHNYSGSSMKINDGEIYNNQTSTTGVIFVNNDSAFEMSGGEIYNNITTSNGTILVKSATAKFSGGKIHNNSAVRGGGVYLKDSANAELTGTDIYSNRASEYGAGIFMNDTSYLNINGGVIRDNISAKSGAGLFLTGSSKLDMESGSITGNENKDGNGGAFVNKSTAKIYGGTIQNNTAVGKGGAIYNEGGYLYSENATLSQNTAGTFGGAICNEEGNVEIKSGTFSGNSAEDGGAVCGYTNSNTKIEGGTFSSNTASNRGHDIYGASKKSESYSTIRITGGEFDWINIQYCKLEIGGDLSVKEVITTNAGPKANYAYISIVSNLENLVKVSPHKNVVEETQSSTVNFIRFDANDNYSNIYVSARNIEFTNSLYTVVENNKILVKTGSNKISLGNDCVTNVPLAATTGEEVSFTALTEYDISNVSVKAKDGSNIDVSCQEGIYTFTMPNQEVIVDYEYSLKDLVVTVNSNVEPFITIEDSYKFKENVLITLNDSDICKVVALYVNYKQGTTKLEIKDGKACFKMFSGATIMGDLKNYYDINFTQSDYIEHITLITEKTDKGLENEEVQFDIQTKTTGEYARYVLSRVYYVEDDKEIDITKNQSGYYAFVMPNHNIQLQYEFTDIFAQLTGEKIIVSTAAQLKEALTGENKIALISQDIILDETIVVGEGEYSIISIGNYKISRASSLKTNMFEIGYKSTLNLSCDNDNVDVGSLIIDGNATNTSDVVGSALFVYRSGKLNIYKNTIISNHKLLNENFNYTTKRQGNSSAGGSAVYNYHGIVNMFGGNINNNYSTKNGSAIYNYGRFNLYGGSINNNTGKVGGTIYNIRVFNQEGGIIENNSTEAYGGAIYSANSDYAYIYIIGGEIKNNSAQNSGGALYIGESGVVFCKGGTISGNTAGTNGGAINSKGTAFLQGTNFISNNAGSKGGAVYGYLKPVFIRGGVFSQNTAANGGAVCVGEGVKLEITAGTFESNIATSRGGAVYLMGDKDLETPTTATITAGTFTSNTASEGDSICVQYAVLKIGGEVIIDGVIETVANATQKYAYIEFISVCENSIQFKPNKYSDDYKMETYNVIRVANGINATELKEKIILSDEAYQIKVENNNLYIYKA